MQAAALESSLWTSLLESALALTPEMLVEETKSTHEQLAALLGASGKAMLQLVQHSTPFLAETVLMSIAAEEMSSGVRQFFYEQLANQGTLYKLIELLPLKMFVNLAKYTQRTAHQIANNDNAKTTHLSLSGVLVALWGEVEKPISELNERLAAIPAIEKERRLQVTKQGLEPVLTSLMNIALPHDTLTALLENPLQAIADLVLQKFRLAFFPEGLYELYADLAANHAASKEAFSAHADTLTPPLTAACHQLAERTCDIAVMQLDEQRSHWSHLLYNILHDACRDSKYQTLQTMAQHLKNEPLLKEHLAGELHDLISGTSAMAPRLRPWLVRSIEGEWLRLFAERQELRNDPKRSGNQQQRISSAIAVMLQTLAKKLQHYREEQPVDGATTALSQQLQATIGRCRHETRKQLKIIAAEKGKTLCDKRILKTARKALNAAKSESDKAQSNLNDVRLKTCTPELITTLLNTLGVEGAHSLKVIPALQKPLWELLYSTIAPQLIVSMQGIGDDPKIVRKVIAETLTIYEYAKETLKGSKVTYDDTEKSDSFLENGLLDDACGDLALEAALTTSNKFMRFLLNLSWARKRISSDIGNAIRAKIAASTQDIVEQMLQAGLMPLGCGGSVSAKSKLTALNDEDRAIEEAQIEKEAYKELSRRIVIRLAQTVEDHTGWRAIRKQWKAFQMRLNKGIASVAGGEQGWGMKIKNLLDAVFQIIFYLIIGTILFYPLRKLLAYSKKKMEKQIHKYLKQVAVQDHLFKGFVEAFCRMVMQLEQHQGHA
jgi:hypothetical protein